MQTAAETAEPARREIYLDVRRANGQIAFANPLLGLRQACCSSSGTTRPACSTCATSSTAATPGPAAGCSCSTTRSATEPRLVNLLANADGRERPAGRARSSTGGSFLSPELSFDGRTILFAYSQAKACEKTRARKPIEWAPEISYHIFRCNADGTGLVQLTDGAWNDFDPCFLPNGRIAFISERRGGYLRCGRHCPVYTLFSMDADGSDIMLPELPRDPRVAAERRPTTG